ncbi:MAG: bifunctional adenosylcobinamide kinase/adenosylcobinamide-phosphate guanylyltransferase [Clostridiales bacterium]|nr:bifunctional adenosylcobinamide kinase/adenosylcobinamide-phosphate guanylyltransferase [Clostridiales bacterium]
MKLIIGGAFQGKLEFARKTYGVADGWIDGCTCDYTEIMDCRGIYHFHEYLRRLLDRDGLTENLTELEEQAGLFADWIYHKNPDLIIVSTELGYGIVPMEPNDRLWRETVGRVCTSLASKSDEVVRVVCGLGTWLKKAD